MENRSFLIIPNWFYPNNLGDNLLSTFIPKLIKLERPNCPLTVYAVGQLAEVMKDNPYVDRVVFPPNSIIGNYNYWKDRAIGLNSNKQDGVYLVFAENHINLWKFWNINFDFLQYHPTANLITVNFLLQLGLEKYLWKEVDLFPFLINRKPQESKTLGIVPATKLAGRPNPHPGCNGIGYRFNGDSGYSWQAFVDEIRQLDSSIKILEFSKEFLDFGDEHVGHLPWKELGKEAGRPRVTVLSDGGMHHVFNAINREVILLGAQTINKPEFFQTKNSTVYKDLHKCGCPIRNLTGWPDLLNSCGKSCEELDPTKLAERVVKDFF